MGQALRFTRSAYYGPQFEHDVADHIRRLLRARRGGRTLQLRYDPALLIDHAGRDLRAPDVNSDRQGH